MQEHALKVVGLVFVCFILLTMGVGAFTVGLYFMKTPPKMALDGVDNPVAGMTKVTAAPSTTIAGQPTSTSTVSGSPTTTIAGSPTTTIRQTSTSTISGGDSTTTIRVTSTSTVETGGDLMSGCSGRSPGECFQNCGLPRGKTGYFRVVDGSCYFFEESLSGM